MWANVINVMRVQNLFCNTFLFYCKMATIFVFNKLFNYVLQNKVNVFNKMVTTKKKKQVN